MASDKDLLEENSEEEQPKPEPYTGETPGQLFREAREAKGLTTQQVADSLRLRKTVIELLEADEFDKLSSATYVRGYLRSVSKALEVDEKRVFEAYGKMGFGEVTVSTITMQSFSKRKVRERNDSRLMLFSYFIIAIVIALAVVWWWQDTNNGDIFNGNGNGSASNGSSQQVDNRTAVRRESPAERVTEDQARGQTTTSDNQQANETEGLTVTSRNQDSAPVVTDDPIDEPTDEPTEGNTDTAATETEVVTDPIPNSQPSATQGADLVMAFSGDCWIKVTDATGTDIAIGVKKAGYTMPLTGEPPFDIILCKPEVVTMTYNGEPVDLSSYRRNRSVTMTLN
ncbi:RodZ domain-containing protein [Pseudidiomarina sp.]|uniref:RodZ domain-containing protein n=1 Tax=Pseudidiomarina sp. TaxID=2081707 RepID=UPI003A98605B